ncbi:MAG: PQQ-binding-like beta-propeller repeat protein [Sandaracinaceae bacterium]
MDRRRAIIAGMWVAALGAIAFIYSTLEPTPREGERRDTGEAPTYVAGEDIAPSESRLELAVGDDPMRLDRYRGGNRHTGRSRFVGPSRPTRIFRAQLGGRISAQAVIGEDGTIYVGAHDQRFHALAPDGTERWSAEVHHRAWSAAAILEGGDLVVGSDADALFRFARDDGHPVWRVETEGDADGAVGIGDDGTIYFTGGPHLYAIDADGHVRWRFRARGAFLLSSPAIDSDGTLYIGSIDDHLYAIASDGRMRWDYETGADVSSSPVIGDAGLIYIGSDDQHVHAVDRDGQLAWKTHVDGYVRAPVALGRNGDVIAAIYGPQPRVVSLDASDGELRWYFPVAVSESPEIGVASGPIVDAEGSIYFGAHDDYVYALSSQGELRWIERTGGDVDAAPILREDGTIIVGCDDGILYAIGDDPDGPDGAVADGAAPDAGVSDEPADLPSP